ncbi:MAG: 1,3-beta-galactosyl-N-acetylhexosamine phosphorylase N-terminal domain-containing protein [Kiritimatiellales bacterium]
MNSGIYRFKWIVAVLLLYFNYNFSDATLTISPAQTNVVISWTGATGQLYSVSSSSDLNSGAWTRVGNLLAGNGAELSVTNRLKEKEFFRVAPDAGPMTTLMWNLGTAPLEPARIIAAGGNTVWMIARAGSKAVEEAGLTAMQTYKVLNNADWPVLYPQYRPRRFIASKPVTAANSGALIVNLLDGYPESYRLEEDLFFRPYWKVWNRTARTEIPADGWGYTDGTIEIFSAAAGSEYSAGFSIVDEDTGIRLDMFSTNAQQIVLNDYQRILDLDVASMVRPTQFAFYFFNQLYPTGAFRDWYGPCMILGRSFIERYEARFNKTFDLNSLFDFGVVRSTNDEKHAGYLELLELQREVAQDFAPRFTAGFHQHRRNVRVRMFWGDSWVGLEPSSPDFISAGFDEIVTAVSVPQDVRRLMTVDHRVRRSSRIGFWEVEPGNGINRFAADWAAFLRAALREFPEGISLGGPPVVRLMNEEPGFEDYMTARFAEFNFLYRLLNGKKAYVHDLKIGVLNSYGALRAWPREFTMNWSQRLWKRLTDLPVDVQWLSFDEILAAGIPADIDVLINAGEAGSAWSGGEEWTPAAAAAIEAFVNSGGAFIGIDAPGVTGGVCVLSNLLGVAYNGAATERAALKIFNGEDAIRRFISPVPNAAWPILNLKPQIAAELGMETQIGSALYNSKMTALPAAERLDTAATQALFTRRNSGAGTAWYLSGVPATEPGFDFFKRLMFHAAGKSGRLQLLDCKTAGGFVYYYPEGNLLIAYNQTGVPHIELCLGLFAGAGTVTLKNITANTGEVSFSGAALMNEAVSVAVPADEFAVWQVVEN